MSLERTRTQEYGDVVCFNSPRLQGIEIRQTRGVNPEDQTPLEREVGWDSVWDQNALEYGIKVKETIDSSVTPFPPLILLVPPQLLGTHEATEPPHPELIEGGFEMKGFKDIEFSSGLWDGQAIAVAAFCGCKEDEIATDNIYSSLARALSEHGGLGLIDEKLEKGDLLILDGHHRAKKAWLHERLKYVPVQLIPFPQDRTSVRLSTWWNDGIVWNAEQVFDCARIDEKYAEAKRTKFGVVGTDGKTRRILDALPELHFSLNNLR